MTAVLSQATSFGLALLSRSSMQTPAAVFRSNIDGERGLKI